MFFFFPFLIKWCNKLKSWKCFVYKEKEKRGSARDELSCLGKQGKSYNSMKVVSCRIPFVWVCFGKSYVTTHSTLITCTPKLSYICPFFFRISRTISFHWSPEPRSLGLPKRERGKKDPGSSWSRVLVTNLCSWEESQLFRILSPLVFVTYKTDLVSLWVTLESSFSTT